MDQRLGTDDDAPLGHGAEPEPSTSASVSGSGSYAASGGFAPATPPPPGSRAEQDLALARVALERGLVTTDEVRTCLAIQADFAAVGNHVPLAQLLIRRRLIDVETFVDLAREVRTRAVRCSQCQVLSLLPPGGRLPGGGDRGVCANCGGVLELSGAREQAVDPLAAVGEAPQDDPDPQAAAWRASENASEPSRPEAGGHGAATVQSPVKAPVQQAGAALGAQPAAGEGGAVKRKRKRRRKHRSLTGKWFGSNEVLDEIARGGMGVVYRARDHERIKIVALKVLRDGAHATEKQIRRFRREVATVKKLKHPNIVGIHDVGEDDGQHWFSMELIDGQALDEVLRKGPLPVRRAFEIIEQVARGIHHAHEHGVIHRDLKPANILLDRNGTPMITDFGLAKNVDHTSAMTKTGAAVGTPFYMPPEQASGDARRVDRRVDVYALGVLLYEMTTGELPFDGETNVEVYRKIMEEEPVSPSSINPRVDSDAERVILKAMAKEREDRYPNALALAEDIHRWLEGSPVEARTPSRVVRAWRRLRRIGPVAASVVGLVFFVGLVVLSVLAIDERRARRSLREQAKTELQLRQAEAASLLEVAAAALRRARKALAVQQPEEALREVEDAIAQLEGMSQWPRLLRYPEINAAQLDKLLAEHAEKRRRLLRDLWITKGLLLANVGDGQSDDKARQAFAEAQRVEPGSPAVHVARARFALLRGRVADAVGAASAALARAPESAQALLLRAVAETRLGRFGAALADARRAAEIERRRHPDRGPARYRPIGSNEPTILSQALMQAAQVERLRGRSEAALSDLDEILGFDPGQFQAYVSRFRVRLCSGDVVGAMEDARALLQIERERPEGHWALGCVEFARGRLEEAIEHFETALGCDRNFSPAALWLGWAYERRGARQAALELYRQVSERRPEGAFVEARALAWLRRAELARTGSEREQAVIAYTQAQRWLPRLLAVPLGRTRLALSEGRIDDAANELERARSLLRSWVPNSGGAGGLAQSQGKSVLASIGEAGFRVVEGKVLLAQGEAKQAQAAFERARLLVGGALAIEANRGLATACSSLDDGGGARQAYARALEDEARVPVRTKPIGRWFDSHAQQVLLMGESEFGALWPEIEGALAWRHGVLGRGGLHEPRGRQSQGVSVAQILLERAVQYAPWLSGAWSALAERRAARGDHTAAYAAFGRALEANPLRIEAALGAVRLLEVEPKPVDLAVFAGKSISMPRIDLALLESAIAARLREAPSEIGSLFLSGFVPVWAAALVGRRELDPTQTSRALASLDRVLEAKPRFVLARAARAWLRARAGERDGARKDITQALALAPPDLKTLAWFEALVFAQIGDRSRSLRALERLERLGVRDVGRVRRRAVFERWLSDPDVQRLLRRWEQGS